MDPWIQQVGTLHPVAITQPTTGNYVFDFGTNFAGWEQLQVSGPAGTKITMTPGELLNSNGTVSQATTGDPIYDTYILSGNGTETWHPDFMYHGFRYLQVTGLPSAPTTSTFTGLELSTANASAGTFTSGNSLLNSINQIVDQAIQNNMCSVLTDCPHREKLGWLEEDHLVFDAVSRTYDVAAYYRELIRNIADAQLSNGLVPDIAPEYTVFSGGFRDDPNWGSTLILSAWQLYQTYGDVSTLRTYYSNMRNYLSYLQSKASGNLLNYGLGEWAAIDTSTPTGVTASYAYYEDAQTMSKIATVLGQTSDATTYSTLTQQIGSAFNTMYFNTTTHNTYSTGSQADDAFALDMGIVPAQYQLAVLQHLVSAIRSNGNHLTVGEIALPALIRALAQGGRSDVLYDVTTQTSYPSYGYMVSTGSTALTEYWDGAAGTGSQDHFMLGYIKSWLSSNLGGIQADPSAVAYNKLIISPAVVGNLTQAASTYNTPYGEASSSWTKTGSVVTLQVTVPANTTATIKLPVNPIQPTATTGQGFQSFQNGYAVYSIGSGSYTFSSDLEAGNLAFHKTVTSNNSLETSDWGVAHLTDGVETSISGAEGYTTNIFPSSNAGSNAPYVDVDLGSNQSFNALTLFPRTDVETASGDTPDFPVSFTIQTAPDGGSYTTVATLTNQANPKGLPQTYSFATTTARHVRIVVTTLGNPALGESGSNYYRLQLAEVELHTVSGVHIHLNG
jgi:alpha-L-rhamnosidase